MTIKDLKDLKKLMALCREQGIDAIEVDGVKMNLGVKPYQVKRQKVITEEQMLSKSYTPGGITEEVKIPTDMLLSEEQILMWSVTGQNEEQ